MSVKSKMRLKNQSGNTLKLPLIIFEEDGAIICYCPPLDLAGYGDSEKEAIASYTHVVGEYLDHTSQHHTLEKDLKRLGWQVKSSLNKSMIPPPITKLLENNSNFKRVFEKFDYKKLSTNIHFPALS